MRILGIDPGYAIVGFGVIDHIGHQLKPVHFGHISTPAKALFIDRLQQIGQELNAVLRNYKPTVVAVEKIFFAKNAKTAIDVAQARGAILQVITGHNLPVFEYNPNEVKIAVTGYGRAEKSQMQKMVQTLLNLKSIPRPDDTADALAVALCHSQSCRLQSALRQAL